MLMDAFQRIRRGEGATGGKQLQTILERIGKPASGNSEQKHLHFRAEMLKALSATVTQPHVRPFVPHRWILTADEHLVSRQHKLSFATTGGSAMGSFSSAGQSSLLTDGATQSTTTTQDVVGRQLREALAFQQHEEDDDDGSLFPMFFRPREVSRSKDDAPDFPASITDTNSATWVVSKKKLGQGAFGTVLHGLGEDGLLVALKFVPLFKDTVTVENLQHEVTVLSELCHENITHYVSCAVADSYFVLITEFVSGGSLADSMKSFPTLPPKLIKRYAIEILEGLAYLHGEGLVHCDIKPENVLITSEGTCKLADFGSALMSSKRKQSEDDLHFRGTPYYMAPEAAQGGDHLTAAADMWSFAISMLTLSLGSLPFARLEGCANTPTNFMTALGRKEYKFNYKRESLCSTVQIISDTCLKDDPEERITAVRLLALIS